MRRDKGKCDIFFGIEHRLRKEDMEDKFERCAAELPRTITAILPGSKWSCLLLRIVLQDVLSEVIKIYLH